jgi:SAM-dependent methyltransferase
MEQVTDPSTQPAQFDAYAASYDEEVNRSLAFTGLKVDYFTRVKTAYLLDLLRQHFGELRGLHLLDVGCGIGNCHAELAPQVGSLSGVDISQASVDQAAARNGAVSYQSYDGATLPHANQGFDAVFTICVMHHVPPGQWAHFASEMKRVLKPGGMAIVFEHNPLNPLTRRVVSNCEFDEDAVLLRQAKVRNLLLGAGLKQVRSRAILSIPTKGPLTRRLDLALGRLGLGAQYLASGVA